MTLLEHLQHINVIKTDNSVNSKYNVILNKHPNVINSIYESTSFLDDSYPIIDRIKCIQFNLSTKPQCITCGESVYYNKTIRNFRMFCSSKCSNSNLDKQQQADNTKRERYNEYVDIVGKMHNTQKQKYGTIAAKLDSVKQKKNTTTLARYGTIYAQSSEIIKEKIKQTVRKKYGVDYVLQVKSIREQIEQTNLTNHGVRHSILSESFKQQRELTLLEKYGTTHQMKNDEFREWFSEQQRIKYGCHPKQKHISKESLALLNNKEYLTNQHHTNKLNLYELSLLLGVHLTTISNKFKELDIEVKRFFQSTGEKQICQFLDRIGIEYITRNRSIIGQELDIVIPKYKLAIEYCGLYWHSEACGKDKWYHYTKWNQCKNQGFQLLTIYDDEWKNKPEIIQRLLQHKMGISSDEKIYARRCIIQHVPSLEKNQFLNQNHIQGDCQGTINLGLYFNNRLVAICCFLKDGSVDYKLVRYATSNHVVGGFTKLLNYFSQNYKFRQIISFADLRVSDGRLYINSGWVCDKIIPPDYYYSSNGHNRYHKFNFRKSKLKKLLSEYNPLLSERENCDNANILRIWDCGKMRFIYKGCN